MTSSNERAAQRLRLLLAIFQEARGEHSSPIDPVAIGRRGGLSSAEISGPVRWLTDEGFLSSDGSGMVSLTPAGVERVTTVLSNPERSTSGMPSANSVGARDISAGGDLNLTVLQGAPHTGGDVAAVKGESTKSKIIIGAIVSFVVIVAAGLVVHFLTNDDDDDQEGSPQPADEGETIVIDNRVTSGPDVMVEDQPAYLSYEARNRCEAGGCKVQGSELQSGDRLTGVVCQTTGDRATNGNRDDSADDINPDLADSTLWYGVRLTNGRLAYISEVWVAKQDRGGLSLPNCSTTEADP